MQCYPDASSHDRLPVGYSKLLKFINESLSCLMVLTGPLKSPHFYKCVLIGFLYGENRPTKPATHSLTVWA